MSAFSSVNVAAINAAGVLSFESSGNIFFFNRSLFSCSNSAHALLKLGLLESLTTNLASSNAASAIEALEVVKTLAEGGLFLFQILICSKRVSYISNLYPVDQWIEPYLVTTLPFILDNLAVPKTAQAG